ncbi:unnamed protein product, partial [Diamesa tonsa]
MGEKDQDSNKTKMHHEYPPPPNSNQELVSKLIAATPSYFFTPAQPGHNFFFSEMLRSFVQKRKADEINSTLKAKSVPKKTRKPSFHYQKPLDLEPEWKKQKFNEDSPKHCIPRHSTLEPEEQEISKSIFQNENDDPKPNSPNLSQDNSEDTVIINVDKDDSPGLPSTINPHCPGLPPPAFYPYVDPLHFFIDLRVSAGHIHDRKKDYLHQALKTNNNYNNPIIGKNRPGSAFKVPNSMQEQNSSNFSAMNLVTNSASVSSTTKTPNNFDYYDSKNKSSSSSINNSAYVLQNLPKIYKKLQDEDDDKNSDEDVE